MKQFFYEPEPNFWMAMTISVNGDKTKTDPSDQIHENIGQAVLKLSYRMFFVFSGSFQFLLDKREANGLRTKLAGFFETYLSGLNFGNSNIFDVFQGIQYLPLGREPFLHVQSFINTVETKFSSIRHSVFLYNDHLVW